MMLNTTTTKFGHLTDQQLVTLIKQDQNYLGEVYKRCKSYSIQFMRKMTNGSKSDYELDDVFHESILILYEKIVDGNFNLTASLQTYLNSVCRFQLLNKLGKEKLYSDYNDQGDKDYDEDHKLNYNSSITDSLDEIEDSTESQFTAIERALEMMKVAGGHCYELLTLYWYHKKSHIEIAQIMNYSNDKTSKKQKSGCQEKLRKMAFNELNN